MDLLAYWKQRPPVHISIAALLRGLSSAAGGDAGDGHKPTPDELSALVRRVNG